MTNDETDVATRVAKGARWLDKHFPADWPTRINLTTLNMEESETCVLGAMYPDLNPQWEDVLDEAGLSDKKAHKLGFSNDEIYLGRDVTDQEWIELRQAWIDLITERTRLVDPMVAAIGKVNQVSNLTQILFAQHEIANAGSLEIHSLVIDDRVIHASWETICDILINLEPANLKVTTLP